MTAGHQSNPVSDKTALTFRNPLSIGDSYRHFWVQNQPLFPPFVAKQIHSSKLFASQIKEVAAAIA